MSASDSGSGSDDEQEKAPLTHDGSNNHKPPRKKSSTKRSLDMQRKISLSKLRDEKKEKESNSHQNNLSSPDSSTASSSPIINNTHSVPLKQKHHRLSGTRNGKISDGYDQYLKQYLLQVPMPKDYGEPSSDDLSSEWDSDVPDHKSTDANKESKVRNRIICPAKTEIWMTPQIKFILRSKIHRRDEKLHNYACKVYIAQQN